LVGKIVVQWNIIFTYRVSSFKYLRGNSISRMILRKNLFFGSFLDFFIKGPLKRIGGGAYENIEQIHKHKCE
jgi:hypothetical protein